ncbi:ECF transporter S component (folate family) [Enterococcus lemanii]|nr:ECF transporter S component (folate family) [Enterococcus lemanii]NLM66812.1 folate family ECF transporter S component [Enterococcus sp.]
MKQKMSAYMISMMGILVALMVILSRILGFEWQFIKISFDFVPKMVMAMMFGPFWTGVGAVIADLLGMSLFARAAFFPGFTLNAFIGGLIYGYFFYKKEVTWKNAILCTIANTVIIGFILTPIWLAIMYNVPLTSWIIWGPRLLKALIMLPVQSALTYVVGRVIPVKQLMKRSRYSF